MNIYLKGMECGMLSSQIWFKIRNWEHSYLENVNIDFTYLELTMNHQLASADKIQNLLNKSSHFYGIPRLYDIFTADQQYRNIEISLYLNLLLTK